MTCMIDRWHDRYHRERPEFNCPYCLDAAVEHQQGRPELLFNGEPVDIVADYGDIYEVQYPHTDRAFLITRDDVVVDAAEWE